MFRIKTDIRQYKCDSPDKVEKLIRNWVIRPTDLIFSLESADWRPIGEHPVFTPIFDVLNEQLRSEPDTLVTRHPFAAPPSAPDGVEINRADSDEITQMTHRTQALRSADDTSEFTHSENPSPQATEPNRKVGRHDLPEELFATAEIQGTFSRDDAAPPLDELAELSEIEPKADDESTMVVELDQVIDDESTKVVELAPEEPANEPESDASPRQFTEIIQSSAFTRASTWEALNAPVPEENDDDLILAEDFSTTSELDAPNISHDIHVESAETQEFLASDALITESTDSTNTNINEAETADFEIPASLLASSKNDDDSEDTSNNEASDITEQSNEAPQETPTPEAPSIPEGYTVELPPIGPTDEDIAIGIHRSTTTDDEKERVFHTPAPQPLTTVIKKTFQLSTPTIPTATLDLPAPTTPKADNAPKNNKTTTYIMAAVVLILVVVIIAALAT